MSGQKVYSERLRLRSDEELEMQNKGLQELSTILEGLDIPHYLSSGTLLGAVREKNFIRWDWDVQFYFKTEDVLDSFDEIVTALQVEGFILGKHNRDESNYKIIVKKYNTEYEMTAWKDDGEDRRRSTWSVPARFFEGDERIEFLGRTYRCMSPPVEYLVHAYGDDWHIPKRIDNKEEYLADSFYKAPKWQRDIVRIIKSVLRPIKRTILSSFSVLK